MRGPSDLDATAEAQWTALLERLRDKGTFSSALAVVDVSGSMSGLPMEVAIALGLLVSEMTSPPFGGRAITFASEPAWHIITGTSTNFLAVFELILSTAIQHHLSPDDMPKILFCFSDMQFDQARVHDSTPWATTHQRIEKMFAEHHYQVPNLVYWNLRASAEDKAIPVRMDQPGVALISGFSGELLKLFLDNKPLDPMTIMLSACAEYPCEIDESER